MHFPLKGFLPIPFPSFCWPCAPFPLLPLISVFPVPSWLQHLTPVRPVAASVVQWAFPSKAVRLCWNLTGLWHPAPFVLVWWSYSPELAVYAVHWNFWASPPTFPSWRRWTNSPLESFCISGQTPCCGVTSLPSRATMCFHWPALACPSTFGSLAVASNANLFPSSTLPVRNFPPPPGVCSSTSTGWPTSSKLFFRLPKFSGLPKTFLPCPLRRAFPSLPSWHFRVIVAAPLPFHLSGVRAFTGAIG